MLTAWLALLMNSLFFSLRLSGGTGSFPRPLKAEEERMYLDQMAQGSMEARNKLIEHNLRLVAHIMKKEESGRRNFSGQKRPSKGRRISSGFLNEVPLLYCLF